MSFFKEKIGSQMAKRLAKQVGREGFLEQLKGKWRSLPRNGNETDIDLVIDGSMERIKKSGIKEAFDIVGITREDLKKVLVEVLRE